MTEDLKRTCELLFQIHKKDANQSVEWTLDTYRNRPSNLAAAKSILIKKEIIFKSKSDSIVTYLNSDVAKANSYDEAARILEQKNVPLPIDKYIDCDFIGSIAVQSSDLSQSAEKFLAKDHFVEKERIIKSVSTKPMIMQFLFDLALLAFAIIVKMIFNISA